MALELSLGVIANKTKGRSHLESRHEMTHFDGKNRYWFHPKYAYFNDGKFYGSLKVSKHKDI